MKTTSYPQNFEFVTYSGQPGKNDRQSLTRIKRHVMHNYLTKQGKPAIKPTRPSREDLKRSRSKAGVSPSGPQGFVYPSELDIEEHETSSDGSPVSEAAMSSAWSPDASVDDFVLSEHASEGGKAAEQAIVNYFHSSPESSPGSSPGRCRADPFDALPVKNLPDDLFWWYPCRYDPHREDCSWIYKANAEWSQSIWDSSCQDQGLFYMVLAQAERNRMALTRSTDDARYLFLRGQGIQTLRHKISAVSGDVPDALILLITSQISLGVVEGDLASAQAHIRAACTLIARKSWKIGPFVLIHAALMDNKLAIAALTRPILECDVHHMPLISSEELNDEVRKRTTSSLAFFPLNFRGKEAEEILIGLHWNNLTFDERHKEIDANSLVLNGIHTLRRLRLLVADIFEESETRRFSKMERARGALLICLEFSAWMHDPAYVIPWVNNALFMKRMSQNLQVKLRALLNIDSEELEDDWKEAGSSSMLLMWVLAIYLAMTCIGNDNADGSGNPPLHLLNTIVGLVRRMGISNQKQLEVTLNMFPWTDHFCGRWSQMIGEQLELPANRSSDEAAVIAKE